MVIKENKRYIKNFAPQTTLESQSGSPQAYGLPTATPDQRLREAQDAVQLQYGAKERGLESAGLDAIAQYTRLVDEEKNYGREVDPRLANIYGALQTSLGENQEANQETYGDAISQVRNWYDQAYGANNQLNQSAMERITGDAERLGIEAGVPGGTARMTEDFLYNQGQNRNAQAGRSANMAELAAKIEALDRNRVGAAGREGGQQRAMLANEIAETIGDLGMNYYNEMRALRNEKAGTQAERGAATRDALREFTQRDFQNTQTARTNSLAEFLGRAGLGLQQSEFLRGNYDTDRNYGLARDELGLSRDQLGLSREQLGLDRELGLGELDIKRQQTAAEIEQARIETDLKRQELAQQQRQFEAELATATSPEAKARAQAELDRIRAETAALTNAPVTYPAGETGFQNYARDNKIPTNLTQSARQILEYARKKGDPNFAFAMVDSNRRDTVNFQERYGFRYRPEDSDIVRRLIDVYYTGIGGK